MTLSAGDRVSEATRQRTLPLVLINQSGHVCFLLGYPGVNLLDAADQPLPFIYSHDGDQMITYQAPHEMDVQQASVHS